MICLVSGGLDSLALWRHLGFPNALQCLIGTKPEEREIEAVDTFAERYGAQVERVRLSMPAELPNGYLPHRNALMILTAMQRDPHVYLAQVAEWGPDKNQRYFRHLERLARAGVTSATHVPDKLPTPRIVTPFASKTKADLITEYVTEYHSTDILTHSWSCYGAGRVHCGKCWGCRSRHTGEVKAGHQVTEYEHQPTPIPISRNMIGDGLLWLAGNGPILTAKQAARRPAERHVTH